MSSLQETLLGSLKAGKELCGLWWSLKLKKSTHIRETLFWNLGSSLVLRNMLKYLKWRLIFSLPWYWKFEAFGIRISAASRNVLDWWYEIFVVNSSQINTLQRTKILRSSGTDPNLIQYLLIDAQLLEILKENLTKQVETPIISRLVPEWVGESVTRTASRWGEKQDGRFWEGKRWTTNDNWKAIKESYWVISEYDPIGITSLQCAYKSIDLTRETGVQFDVHYRSTKIYIDE